RMEKRIMENLKWYTEGFEVQDICNALGWKNIGAVAMAKQGRKVYVKPVSVNPDELQDFRARIRGFEPGPEVCWGGSHWAPAYWVKSLGQIEYPRTTHRGIELEVTNTVNGMLEQGGVVGRVELYTWEALDKAGFGRNT